MKKKLLLLVLSGILTFSLLGCGDQQAADQPVTPPDLTGEWQQVNSDSDTMYHRATIQGDTIEINWVETETETVSLYWAGSFVAPTTADEPYTWESANDTEKTSLALLASSDPTKTMTYENGQISYDASFMGTTKTVRLEKVEATE